MMNNELFASGGARTVNLAGGVAFSRSAVDVVNGVELEAACQA